MDEGRGAVATLLVQEGTLQGGDVVVCRHALRPRPRHASTIAGQPIEEAGAVDAGGSPGLDEVPDAGDQFYVVDALTGGRGRRRERPQQRDASRRWPSRKITLDNLFEQLEADRQEGAEADPQGRRAGLGRGASRASSRRSQHDRGQASACCTRPSAASPRATCSWPTRPKHDHHRLQRRARQRARRLAEADAASRSARTTSSTSSPTTCARPLEGMLEPELREKITRPRRGPRRRSRSARSAPSPAATSPTASSSATAKIRLIRDGVVVENDRTLEALKRFKDDANEVRAGFECGMKIAGYDDIKVGDVLECYKTQRSGEETVIRRHEDQGSRHKELCMASSLWRFDASTP